MVSSWSLLPPEILDIILQMLPLPDCFSFHKVCPSWRAVFLYRRSVTCPPPFMVITSSWCPDIGPFWSLHGGQLMKLQSPSLKLYENRQILGASHGWLVINSGRSIHMLNPLTKEQIPLPSFWNETLYLVALSADPRSGDCVLALSGCVDDCNYSFWWCRPGDLRWSSFDFDFNVGLGDSSAALMFHGSKLYVFGKEEKLHIVTFDPKPKKMAGGCFKSMNWFDKRMVQSDQELLLVGWRHSSDRGDEHEFDVFKQVEEPDKWVRVESLGDRVLLLGIPWMRIQSLSTDNLMGSDFESNCIYYPSPIKEFLMKFSVADGSSQKIEIPLPKAKGDFYHPHIEWIVPQAWTATATLGAFVHKTSFWSPPSVDFVKINFDVKLSMDSATYGIVVRNHLGHVVVCKFGQCSATDVLGAVSLALLYGMELACLLNFSRVMFESDDEEVISLLAYKWAKPPQNAHGIIMSCKEIVAKFDNCSFHCVRWEGNEAARRLSILAQSDQCPYEGTDVTCLLAPDVISDVISAELPKM